MRAAALALGLSVAFCVGAALAPAARAEAPTPQWHLMIVPQPTDLAPGSSGDRYLILAINTGSAEASGTITVSDRLPAGVSASAISGRYLTEVHGGPALECTPPAEALKCSYQGSVLPGMALIVEVEVSVGAAASGPLVDEAEVAGGGAPEVRASQTASLSSEPAPYGLSPGSFFSQLSSAQAGGHPNLTTGFALSERAVAVNSGAPRDFEVELPVGLVGNPTAVPRCTVAELQAEDCPADSAVGSFVLAIAEAGSTKLTEAPGLVYNLVPEAGEPAALGFDAGAGIGMTRLDTAVRSAGPYNVHVSIRDVSEGAAIVISSLTLWGVPSRYNGPGPLKALDGAGGLPFGGPSQEARVPYMVNGSECGAGGEVSIATDSWEQPGLFTPTLSSPLGALSGCEALGFAPSIAAAPATSTAGAPAGYQVGITVPQDQSPEGLATPDVRSVKLTLPEGTVVSPAAANGLQACSTAAEAGLPEGQFGLHSGRPGDCPQSSKIGTVKIETPLLATPLEGSVYVAQPECSPCTSAQAAEGKLVRLLIEAQGSGVLVKLAGRTQIDQQTGTLTTVFEENPQLPFDQLTLSLKGGPDAPLVNPGSCGAVRASASITPWSSLTATQVSAPPVTIEGCSAPAFSPTIRAGMTASAAGGSFSPFAFELAKPAADQALSTITLSTPPGLSGIIAGIPRCEEAQANAGSCPAASQIGTVSAQIGPSSDPYTVEGGGVYLTDAYGGGPFGLSIVVPAKAGPFTLAGVSGTGSTGSGDVVTRAAIDVNPTTAALTIRANPLPSVLDGIPLDIQRVMVDISRSGFMFNPTDCNPLQVASTITSAGGLSAGPTYPFQSVNCATLPFKPGFAASSAARISRQEGASLTVSVSSHGGPTAPGEEANIAKVEVQLPKKLPSRLSTLNRACTQAQFAANPYGCPPASFVGGAEARTPLLAAPLKGPAIFVSRGAQFPNLEVLLEGEGVKIDLEGHTQIKDGITYSRFEGVPDAPISSFTLSLPEGEHSALGSNGSLCVRRTVKRIRRRVHGRLIFRRRAVLHAVKLTMPTTITAQNGAVERQTTVIDVLGCPKLKAHAQAKKSKKSVRRRPRRAPVRLGRRR